MRPQKLGGRPAAWRFFYPRPVFPLPAFEGPLVPLQSTSFGLLVRPPEPMQELASGVEMARHVEAPLNHFRHSLGRPQFCAVTMGNGSLKQDPDQPTLLASRESSRTTRRRFSPGAILSGSSEKTHATPRANWQRN